MTFLLFIGWASGAAVLLIREVVGIVRLRDIVDNAEPIRDERWLDALKGVAGELSFRSLVELKWSDQLGPCAAGWLRPVILLPRTAVEWTDEMRAQVLTHELAHFRRRDLWMIVVVRFIAAVHWFNPLAGILRRAMESEFEQACDALVVRQRGDAIAYVESLLTLAAVPLPRAAAPAATLLSRRRRQLEERIRALLSNNGVRRARWTLAEAVIVAAALVMLFACTTAGPVSPGNGPDSTASEVETRLSADPFPGEH